MLKISTNDLTWNPKTATFSTEASDLPRGALRLGDPVVLYNPKTGGEALFKYSSAIRVGVGLGDGGGWRYLCQRPGLPDVHLVVFND
jgi:hypothetical protein